MKSVLAKSTDPPTNMRQDYLSPKDVDYSSKYKSILKNSPINVPPPPLASQVGSLEQPKNSTQCQFATFHRPWAKPHTRRVPITALNHNAFVCAEQLSLCGLDGVVYPIQLLLQVCCVVLRNWERPLGNPRAVPNALDTRQASYYTLFLDVA